MVGPTVAVSCMMICWIKADEQPETPTCQKQGASPVDFENCTRRLEITVHPDSHGQVLLASVLH